MRHCYDAFRRFDDAAPLLPPCFISYWFSFRHYFIDADAIRHFRFSLIAAATALFS